MALKIGRDCNESSLCEEAESSTRDSKLQNFHLDNVKKKTYMCFQGLWAVNIVALTII